MRVPIRLGSALHIVAAAAATTLSFAAAGPALASPAAPASGYGGAVFVQTDNTAGNQVVAYHRAPDGALSLAGSYATGGARRASCPDPSSTTWPLRAR